MKTLLEESGVPSAKVALITGAASGIGLAIARALASRGCQIIIADIDEVQGRAAATELEARFVKLDVANEQNWQAVMALVNDWYGGLDILVNNAGIYLAGTIEDVSVDDWLRVQNINVVGVLLGCKYAIGAMKARGGSIINLSSGAALRPNSAAAAYSASKSAVWSLTRTTALHCAEQKYNIRCNSVHPGMVDTAMVSSRALDDQARKALYDKADKLHPLGRMAQAEDIAAAVAFLASDKAAYITGVALPVDGGYAIN